MRAKSPLVAMLEMLSVAVPLLVMVTVFPALVLPTTTLANESEVVDRVTAGPPPAVMVRAIVVELVRFPDVPLMVTVEVPLVALPVAVSVSVLVVLAGFGENCALTPLGRPVAVRLKSGPA